MKSFVNIFWVAVFLFLVTSPASAALPRDDDEMNTLPKGTQFLVLRDIPVPAGIKKIFLQRGIATPKGEQIDGNSRYCFMLLKMPSTRERVLEKDVLISTNGTYRGATGVVEIEIALPNGIYDIGCVNAPKDGDRRTTVGQMKEQLSGIMELNLPGPDPIR